MYPKQIDAIFTPARYSVIEASTKSGKTVGCIIWLFEQALQGKICLLYTSDAADE